MKKYILIFFISMMSLSLTSCFKELDYTFDEVKQVEFETAVRTAPAAGYTFPVIATTRTAGNINLQINLIGEQLKSPEDLTITVDTAGTGLLTSAITRAVEGTHFNLNGGKVTIKPDTSFVNFRLSILNPGATAGRQALVVLKLNGTDKIKAAENYRRVAYRINLQ
jgi:hypothetical protein